MDLFEKIDRKAPYIPLADRMRPMSLKGFVGQEHLLGPGCFLSQIPQWNHPLSMIFWGPPGSGKTTLARLIAQESHCHFVSFPAVLGGVKEIRGIVEEAKQRRKIQGQQTLLFVDEIHRFNRSQQDSFLPHVEDGTLILMGATTENPSFEINAPLLSRCRVLLLNILAKDDILRILENALENKDQGFGQMKITCSTPLLQHMADWSQGDARRALNLFEAAVYLCQEKEGERVLSEKEIKAAAQERVLLFDKDREEHYNIISAFIKSMRGSDPDASVYWLARMLESGEDPLFIARRMLIFASEDIGNADPQALQVAVAALHAFQAVGLPEGWIPLSQAVTFLASAPKSNASYLSYKKASKRVRESGALPVPIHLRNASSSLMKSLGYGKDYLYPHDFPGHWVRQDYLPKELLGETYYKPSELGYEKQIKNRIEEWRVKRDQEGPKKKGS